MDFQRFGIDPRLAQAAEDLGIDFFFYEKMLSHAVENKENVCAKISLEAGREEVVLLPVLQWLLSGESRKALVVVPDLQSGDRCAQAIDRLGAGAGIETCRVGRASLAEGGPESAVFEGDPSSAVVIGKLSDLMVACPPLDLREYGFIVADGADRLAESPPDLVRQFVGALIPSWERRVVLACGRISVKTKNLARDLADNPTEICIDGEVAKAQSVLKETWDVSSELKFKFLLGLLERDKPARVCVFCNLRDTAEEVSRRLEVNGLGTDYILGALAVDRKLAVLDKVKAGNCPCLVLTDQGAEGLEIGAFPLVVNYDIPLEPEFFVKRIEMLDRADPGAKVVSLACERYNYGLPIIESYIDAKLEALPADESLLSIADKSEGMSFDRKQRREDGRRDEARRQEPRNPDEGRRGQGQARGDGRSGGRGQQRRDAYPRDANRSRDSQRDAYPREDRSPEIRKSISEATGGALDMGSNSPLVEKPRIQGEARRQQPTRGSGDQDRRGGARRSEGPRKPEGPRGDSRRGGDRGKQQAPRSQAPRQSSPRSPARAKPPKAGAVSSQNPYDMPIEERMKQYREKYGQGLNTEKREGGQRGSPKRPASHGQGAARSQAGAAPRPASGDRSVPTQAKPEGLLGHLFSAFKKKPE
jgi:ATP-dependent RNA helicase RhlB